MFMGGRNLVVIFAFLIVSLFAMINDELNSYSKNFEERGFFKP